MGEQPNTARNTAQPDKNDTRMGMVVEVLGEQGSIKCYQDYRTKLSKGPSWFEGIEMTKK